MDVLPVDPWWMVLVVFAARVLDVSMGTVRTILVIRGYRLGAAAIGFFEILIWLLAAGQVIQNLDRWHLAVAYAAGFAAGNYVGIWLEAKLALGLHLVRAISADRSIELAAALRAEGHEVIELDARAASGGAVEILFLVVRRRRLPRLMELIRRTDPRAICTVTDVKRHDEPLLPTPPRRRLFGLRSASKRK